MKYHVTIVLVAGLLLAQCTPAGDVISKNVDPYRSEIHGYTSRFIDGRFIGGKEPMKWSIADFLSTTCDFLFTANDRTPSGALPQTRVDLSSFNSPHDDQLSVTWLGHSSLMINIDGYRLLTDPVFEKRVSLVGPTRFNGEIPLEIDQLPPIDAVIISHDHYDHLNKYSVRQLNTRSQRFIVPLAVGARLVKWGVPETKIVELDWWQEYHLDANLMVAATPAQHFSGRGLTDRNRTLWASWVIAAPRHKIFFSGDSGYFSGFKQIGAVYGPFDMTFIECGAYNEAWADVHMFPEQTVQAHRDLGGKVLHPVHWGTFNLALHPWYEPMERLTAAARVVGVQTAIPMVGGTTVFGEDLPSDEWWRPFMNPPRQQRREQPTTNDHTMTETNNAIS